LLLSGVTSLVDISPPWNGWIELFARSGMSGFLAPGYASARWYLDNDRELKFAWAEARGRILSRCYHFSMPRNPKPQPDDPEQSKRFIDMAREVEAETRSPDFERVFRKVAKQPKGAPPEPSDRRFRRNGKAASS
jgi:hypothetical protein